MTRLKKHSIIHWLSSFLFVYLLFPVNSYSKEWSDTELVLGSVATTMYVADWATTRNMTKRYHENFEEKGPVVKGLFGEHPTTRQVDGYFAVLIPSVLFAADSFPQHRKLILVSVIVAEALVVRNNIKIGMKFDF